LILLDTHTLIWLLDEDKRLGPAARQTIAEAQALEAVAVSAITFWEIGLLVRKQRLQLRHDLQAFRRQVLEDGASEVALDGEVALTAARLDLHPDPADRFILATALVHGTGLITADERLLAWQGPVARQNARL